MGSRIREKTKHLFEVFVEIAKPNGKDEDPFIIQKYPTDFDDKEALVMIPRFAYPCPNDASQVDHFTFVLTDLDSMFRFGYCRHATGHQTCLCIVSWLPWCEIFYKLLDLLAEITNRSENNEVNTLLHATYTQEVPLPSMPVTIVADQDMFSFSAPDPNALPKIPGSRNLTEYYNAVDPNNMMIIFASMLHERRIYMTSKKLSRLTACIHAAEALLYPMHWQHLYIPVLPANLIEYVSAPMPYVIGVHSNLVENLKLKRVDVADAVIVDLDANTVSTEYDDLGDLPEDVSSYLKRNLKTDVIKNSIMKSGDSISMAFLNALVRLIGGYSEALKFRPGEPITFDPEAFVRSRPAQATQDFLEGMLTLQIFQQFICGRLEILNTGGGFKDIFEVQATRFAGKLNSQSRYKEWLKSVKKSGKKSWNGLKVKAAPMMSTAVHSVKEQGKKAMADFKIKFSGLTDNEDKKWTSTHISGGIVHGKSHGPRPITAHAGTLPRTLRATSQEFDKRNKPPGRSKSIEDSHDDSQLRLSYHTVDMTLMTDTDIQAAMLRSASAEILTNQAEDSSSDSDSDFESDGTDTNIAFDAFHSSDDGSNSITSADEKSITENKPEVKSSVPGDKLIFTRPRPAVSTEPVPAPRKKRAHSKDDIFSELPKSDESQVTAETRNKTGSVQDAPLIKFDSSESEPTDSDNFDPLVSGSVVGSTDTLNSITNMGDGQDADAGLRGYKTKSLVDTVDNKISTEDSITKTFDPLSDLAGLSFSNNMPNTQKSGVPAHLLRSDPLSSHSPRRDSADLLMHEWCLASLSKSHNTSSARPPQPLRMRYPNNPFILGRPQNPALVNSSAFTSAPLRGNLVQGQNQGLYLGQRAFDFQKVNQHGLKPFPASTLPSPSALSPASYAPYSRPHPSMASRVMTSSSVAPQTSVSSHTQHPTPSKHVGISSASSSEINSQKKSDFLFDLQDIDFGNKTTPQKLQQQQTTAVVQPLPSQPKWETFD